MAAVPCPKCGAALHVEGAKASAHEDAGGSTWITVTLLCPQLCGQPDRTASVPATEFTDIQF